MAASTPVMTASFITLGVTALIVAVLWRPMHRLLTDLCGTEQRGLLAETVGSIFVLGPADNTILGP
jgi:hypothetical protein